MLIGSPDGRTIPNTVLQVILNVIDFQMDIAEAIAARIHHQWLPDVLEIEKFGASSDTLRLLESYIAADRVVAGLCGGIITLPRDWSFATLPA